MKKLGILGMVLSFMFGIGLLFVGAIMTDLETTFTNTATLIWILGLVLCGAGFVGVLALCGAFKI